ncbi:MAG: nucleotidyltransferase domain-containing protein [Candidatus Omnitrophota bacterium]
MKYGLSNEQLETIRSFLAKESAIEEAVLFGSRATGIFKEASDIDIAIKGESFDIFMAASLKSKLEEETHIPYFFDIVAYQSIKSEDLKQHIRDNGIVICRKERSEPVGRTGIGGTD